MEMYICHIGLILSMLYLVGSTASRIDVSPPNGITFGLKGMFYLFWEWKPSRANCSLIYVKEMKSIRNEKKIREKNNSPHWELEIDRLLNFDLNGGLSLFVEAQCNNMTIDSMNRTVQLAPGDEKTSVNNFQCVWHYQEYVKCNWQPGPNTPSNINYRILYWIKDRKFNPEANSLYTLAKFWDLLETGSTCELYSSGDKGCQFLLNKSIHDYAHFAMVVTDTSRSIKPYIYYGNADQIAKFKPPKIVAYRTNDSIHVSWNNSQDIKEVEYQVLLRTLHSEHSERYEMSVSSTQLNALPDITYTVKVRVKLSRVFLSDENRYTWSDWSKEIKLQGKDDQRIILIILPLIISAVVIIAAVFILVYMEKLKAIICPQIPDPAGIFPKDIQQWLKTDIHIVYCKPEKEEICPVYLIESPSGTKCV